MLDELHIFLCLACICFLLANFFFRQSASRFFQLIRWYLSVGRRVLEQCRYNVITFLVLKQRCTNLTIANCGKRIIIFLLSSFVDFNLLLLSKMILVRVPRKQAVGRMCSVKKVFLEISQNSQENSCARDSFLIKLNFAKFLRAPFFKEHLWWLLLQERDYDILFSAVGFVEYLGGWHVTYNNILHVM